jgi:hypothetical protein
MIVGIIQETKKKKIKNEMPQMQRDYYQQCDFGSVRGSSLKIEALLLIGLD